MSSTSVVHAGLHAPINYLPPSALQLEQQARFEVEAFDMGVQRFREAVATRALTELTAGQRLLREIIPGLATAICAARDKALEAINGNGSASHPPPWAWPIQVLADDPAGERLAVITMGCVLSTNKLQHDEGGYHLTNQAMPVTPMARQISRTVRLQVEYDRWSGTAPELEKRLKARYPTVNRNVWRRWRDKVKALREEPWDMGTEVALGAHLIHLLLGTAPSRFKLETIALRGKPTAHLVISDETLALIDDVTTRGEVARPFLMPMVCPPIPWTYH